jgi:hypothetical protein
VSIIASLLTAAFLAHPQPSCAAAVQTGTFRFTAVDAHAGAASSTRVGILVLENVDGCLEATMLTDTGAPSIIDDVRLSGDSLTGSIHTTAGRAKVSLHLDGARVAGSIVDDRHVWAVNGKRTSGIESRTNGE